MVPLARFVPRIVSRNWRLKLAALGLAVFLWALIRTEPRTGVNLFTVPVNAQVSDLEWVLAGEPDPPTVQVRLRGVPVLVRAFSETDSVLVQRALP